LLMRKGGMPWQCKLVLRSCLKRIQHFVVILKLRLQCELSRCWSKTILYWRASPINSLLISFCGFWIL
jgi:hypothetical protein